MPPNIRGTYDRQVQGGRRYGCEESLQSQSCALEPSYSSIHPGGICSQQGAVVNPLSSSLLSWVIWCVCQSPPAAGCAWRYTLGCTNLPLASHGASVGSGGGWGTQQLLLPLPAPAFALHRCSHHPAPSNSSIPDK